MDRERLNTILADLHGRLKRIYGDRLVRLILFGSQARGDAGSESDIDMLVVLDGPVRPYDEIERTVADVSDVSLAYDAAVECVFVSLEDFEHERSLFMRAVRREGAAV